LGVSIAGTLTRLIRSEMLEVLRQDYVRTAQAKGLRGKTVIWRHALRNALLPFVTLLGSQVTVLIGGSVVLESIFSLPGMGRYLLSAVLHNDIPAIQTVNFLAALFVISMNLIVDMTYSFIDPRVHQS
jgi:peptide/nickel transport system permease protein